MWSVVVFKDNSVEVVPSDWFNKGFCAWPKRNLKSSIDRQVSPNGKEFRYLSARKLGKDFNDYSVAQDKANLAKMTSDISTNDSSQENDTIKTHKLKKKVCQEDKTKTCDLWSPASIDVFDDSDTDPHYTLPGFKCIDQETVFSAEKLTKPQNIPYSYPDRLVVKRLDFERRSSVSPSTSNKNIKFKNIDQNHETSKPAKNIIYTSSSPFKVTHVENLVASTSQPVQISGTQDSTNYGNVNSDTLDKVNRNVLYLKYEIKSLHEKIDKLEELITYNGNSTRDNDIRETDVFQNTIHKELPLGDEDALQSFENKLLDNVFKTQMITELSRYVRNTLPSTIRCMMRFLFRDELLQEYSYKGQKKKKIFKSLTTCSILFDAVKNMKRYNKYDKIDVEQPIKIFIAGAKFRGKPVHEAPKD